MNSILAQFPNTDQEGKRNLLWNGFLIILLMSLLSAALIRILPFSEKPYWYVLFNTPSFLIEFLLFLQQRNKSLIAYGVVASVLQLAVCVIPAAMGYPMDAIFQHLVLLAIAKFLLAIVLLLKNRPVARELVAVLKQFQTALPLMLSFLVSGSAEYIDGAIMKAKFNLEQFSVFRYGSREFPLFTILAATLSTSFIPAVAANKEAGLHEIRTKSLQYMHWFFPIAIMLTLISRPAYSFFFSAKFEESGSIFAILLLLTAPRLLFPQSVLTAMGRNRVLLTASVVEMLVNAAASWILAKQLGMAGVAYGTVIAFITEKLILCGWLYWKERIAPSSYIPMPQLMLYSVALIVALGLSNCI
ncbi:MAG: polysaccharide biosynthesis C-terminal domain-containing protein [Chitinophagales bacterium]